MKLKVPKTRDHALIYILPSIGSLWIIVLLSVAVRPAYATYVVPARSLRSHLAGAG